METFRIVSDDGCKEFAQKKNWFKESFFFLSSHIVRVVSSHAVSVSIVVIHIKDKKRILKYYFYLIR